MDNARKYLSDWRTWIGIAYFGLVAVVVALGVYNSRLNDNIRETARISAARDAEIRMNTVTRRQQCLQSIPSLKKINMFLEGVRNAHEVLLINAKAALDQTSPSDRLYRLRKESLERLKKASADVEIPAFPVPTKKKCLHG